MRDSWQSLFPQRFLKGSLRVPEGKQALFVFMFGIGRGGLLLQQIAHQHRGLFELIVISRSFSLAASRPAWDTSSSERLSWSLRKVLSTSSITWACVSCSW